MIPVSQANAAEVAQIQKALLAPFELNEVKFKPAMVKGNRALALAYIDARLVMDRLDKVVFIDGWKDEYTVLPSGEVECRLSVKLGGEWVTKADVGGQSEQPDEGDRMKAAYSDALKRAAVKFGIGRFLYSCTNAWHDYDPVKKGFAYPLALSADGKIVAAPRAAGLPPQKPSLVTEHEKAFDAARTAADVNKVIAAVRGDIEAGRLDDRGVEYLRPVKDKAIARTAPKQTA